VETSAFRFHYLDVTHLQILIILKSWHKDSDFTLIIGNFATKVAKMGCISAKSKLSAFDLHHLCHHI